MATEARDLPADDPASVAGEELSAADAATVSAAADDVETLDGLKTKLKDTEKQLKQAHDPKRVEFWQSKADRLENDIKEVSERLQGVGPKWVGFIREGAARGMTAAQLLDHLEKQAKNTSTATVNNKAGRADALEIILAENRAGHTGFAQYLTEELDLGAPVTQTTIETHRARFNRTTDASAQRKDAPAAAAGAAGKPAAPRVPGGSGAPNKGKGPAWQPGKRGVDLIAAGLRGE